MTTTSTSTVVPPPYSSSSSLDEYLSSISPPRELICPITQELYRDPVLACDGHTYERKSLTTWFGTGNIRSPVTNSILDSSFGDGDDGDGDGDDGGGGATNSFGERRGNGMRGRRNENFMVSNLAVSSMANAHRERLGRELVRLCARDGRRYHDRGALIGGNKSHDEDEEDATMVGGGGGGGDGDRMAGAMIEGLLDAGADPDGRDETSNTPLHLLIRCGNIRLAYRLLDHDANVTLTNDDGMDCIATAEEELATRRRIRQQRRCPSSFVDAGGVAGGGTTTCVDDIDVSEWTDFVDELRRRVALEKARSEARDLARSRANDEHRERQRTLAANAWSNDNDDNIRGLGRLEDGVGYFPSLAALQFQSSIPGPSPSLAEFENREKERLNRILKGIGYLVLAYFLIS